MKIKHSVSSSLQSLGGTFSIKKLYMGEETLLRKFREDGLHGNNDQIMQGAGN